MVTRARRKIRFKAPATRTRRAGCRVFATLRDAVDYAFDIQGSVVVHGPAGQIVAVLRPSAE